MRDLVGHDRRPSAYLLYLYLWGQLAGSDASTYAASLSTLSESSGLSKRAVQQGLQWLERRGLIRMTREKATAIATIEVRMPWRAPRRA